MNDLVRHRFVKAHRSVAAPIVLTVLTIASTPLWAQGTVWKTYDPHGGSIRMLAIEPQNANVLYAGTNDGLFKSTDGGASWVKSPLPAYVTPLVIHPTNPTILYAGAALCSERCGRGVFKSTDSGTTWTTANSGLPAGLNSLSLAIDPHEPATLFAATSAGLFKSTDSGTTWLDSGLSGIALGFLTISSQNPKIIYAATPAFGSEARLFRSTDDGQTWSALPFSFRSIGNWWGSFISALEIDPQDASTVYVAADQHNDQYGLFKSRDGGVTWTGWDDAAIYNSGLRANAIYDLLVDPQRSSLLYAGTNNGVFMSTDAGTTWQAIGFELPDRNPVYRLALTPHAPRRLYAGSYSGKILEATFASPVLTLDSARYCLGGSWSLNAMNALSQTSVRLIGNSNGQSWEIAEWLKTDASGAFSVAGTFAGGTEGSHILRVEIAGALSEPISFVVSNCPP